MATVQIPLLNELRRFPQTRYQGSKLKLLPWIWEHVEGLGFHTVLDALGGTGCVSYLFKCHGKAVTFNDILKANWMIGRALIENKSERLTDDEIEWLLSRHEDVDYPSFVQDTFAGIYFKSQENRWIDTVRKNITLVKNKYKQALAYHALFQTCIIKRPFNLFHRANLYMRTSNVRRNFGNKTTWDKPFETHFRDFARQGSSAVFDNGEICRSLNKDVFDIEGEYDLVYVDPPYMNKEGIGPDYLDFYHFLEGLLDYEHWPRRIDYTSKNLRLRRTEKCVWLDRKGALDAFDRLFNKFRNSILVVSYRTDGIPRAMELADLLAKGYKKKLRKFAAVDYRYVLSTNGDSREALIVAM